MISIRCKTKNCDNRIFTVSEEDLADAEGVIECEYCGEYCEEVIKRKGHQGKPYCEVSENEVICLIRMEGKWHLPSLAIGYQLPDGKQWYYQNLLLDMRVPHRQMQLRPVCKEFYKALKAANEIPDGATFEDLIN